MFIIQILRKKHGQNVRKKKFPLSHVYFNTVFDKKTILEGKNLIKAKANISGSNIGLYTYIGVNCQLKNAKIGRFCSIANNVHIQPYTHPTDYVSTHPLFYNGLNIFEDGNSSNIFEEHIRCADGYDVNIGNDVWIGENVTIKGGITIGDGAIIGMGALVTKNVPPYAIVGGVPAKIIRFRFEKEIINELLKIKWWNWTLEEILDKKNLFNNSNVFLKNIK